MLFRACFTAISDTMISATDLAQDLEETVRGRRWADAFLEAARCSESKIFSPRAALWSFGFC
jgi:hypothetical protein